MATDVEKMMKDYFAAFNSHDVNKFLSFFTDDCVYEDAALGVVWHGKKELNGVINSVFTNVPDLKHEMKSAFGAGDWAGSEWVGTGTHFHSSNSAVPATGKHSSVRGASIIEMRKGKISRNTDYWDRVTFMQQIGLMPAPSK